MHGIISDKLVQLVENNTDVIIDKWLERMLVDPSTSNFTEENLDYIRNMARSVLNNLGQWVHYDTTKEDIEKRYEQEGKELFKKEVPLCEVFRFMALLKRLLWLFVVNESAHDSAFELQQMRELNDRVVLFFDRSLYSIISIYMDEMNGKMKKLWDLTDEDTEDIFHRDSFYNKS